MKARRSPLNENTRWKVVPGATIRKDALRPEMGEITIRVTHDEHGKSLSLENGEIMLMIPLEPATDMIDTVF